MQEHVRCWQKNPDCIPIYIVQFIVLSSFRKRAGLVSQGKYSSIVLKEYLLQTGKFWNHVKSSALIITIFRMLSYFDRCACYFSSIENFKPIVNMSFNHLKKNQNEYSEMINVTKPNIQQWLITNNYVPLFNIVMIKLRNGISITPCVIGCWRRIDYLRHMFTYQNINFDKFDAFESRIKFRDLCSMFRFTFISVWFSKCMNKNASREKNSN